MIVDCKYRKTVGGHRDLNTGSLVLITSVLTTTPHLPPALNICNLLAISAQVNLGDKSAQDNLGDSSWSPCRQRH